MLNMHILDCLTLWVSNINLFTMFYTSLQISRNKVSNLLLHALFFFKLTFGHQFHIYPFLRLNIPRITPIPEINIYDVLITRYKSNVWCWQNIILIFSHEALQSSLSIYFFPFLSMCNSFRIFSQYLILFNIYLMHLINIGICYAYLQHLNRYHGWWNCSPRGYWEPEDILRLVASTSALTILK